MTPSQAIDFIARKKDEILEREVINLRSELVDASPVGNPSNWNPPRVVKGYVGGNYKASWEPTEKIITGWRIVNTAQYADVLWGGSSKQWSGGAPVLKKFGNRIKKEFDKVKA